MLCPDRDISVIRKLVKGMCHEPQVTHKARADGSELMICSSTMSELTLEHAGVARSVVLLSTKLLDGSDELKLSRSGHNLGREDTIPSP